MNLGHADGGLDAVSDVLQEDGADDLGLPSVRF